MASSRSTIARVRANRFGNEHVHPDVAFDFLGDGGPHGTFGADYQLETGTDVSVVSRARPDFGDQLFYDTDDHQLYEVTGGRYPEATLLATFANDVQLQTSDFFFI